MICGDQQRKAEARLDALLLAGLDSGTPVTVTPEYWDEKYRQLAERVGKLTSPQI